MKKKRNLDAGKAFLVSVISIFLGLVVGALLMLACGINPFEGYSYLLRGAFSGIKRFSNTLANGIPLILTGLSVAFAFRTGLFNIGAPGQMLMGALPAMIFAFLNPDLPRGIMLPAMLLISLFGGMLWAAVPGLLKARFNVNEVVSCIMMNWIAYWIVYIVVSDNFKSATISTQSKSIPAAASLKTEWLTELTGGSSLNLRLFVAVIATAVIAIILNKTVSGYQMKAVGFNPFAARYAGINVNKNAILAMAIAGAMAGLAGLTYFCGYQSNIQIGSMPSQGFDGIAVALLANCSPLGVVLSGLFFAVLQTGKGFMNAMCSIPPEIADTIIGIIIYFAATSKLISLYMDKIKHFFVWAFCRITGREMKKEGV